MKQEFTTFRLSNRSDIFLVIEKGSEELPLIVHGILKVLGKNYKDSFCMRNSISDELTISGEIERFENEAQREYFNVD